MPNQKNKQTKKETEQEYSTLALNTSMPYHVIGDAFISLCDLQGVVLLLTDPHTQRLAIPTTLFYRTEQLMAGGTISDFVSTPCTQFQV